MLSQWKQKPETLHHSHLVFLSWSRIFFSISASVRVSSKGHHWSASPVLRMAISTVGRGFSLVTDRGGQRWVQPARNTPGCLAKVTSAVWTPSQHPGFLLTTVSPASLKAGWSKHGGQHWPKHNHSYPACASCILFCIHEHSSISHTSLRLLPRVTRPRKKRQHLRRFNWDRWTFEGRSWTHCWASAHVWADVQHEEHQQLIRASAQYNRGKIRFRHDHKDVRRQTSVARAGELRLCVYRWSSLQSNLLIYRESLLCFDHMCSKVDF